jgi:hypothetical protein
MWKNSFRRSLLVFILLLGLARAAIIANSTPAEPTIIAQNAVFFTLVTNVSDLSGSAAILSQLAVPGFSRKHGFNYVALDGWSCSQPHGPVASIW